MSPAPNRRKSANPHTLEQVLRAVGGRTGAGGRSFNDLLAHLKSEGVVANHRSLRRYLDLLVASQAVKVTNEPSASPNLRPKQVYTPSGKGPCVKVGEGALTFHGLQWDTGSTSLRDLALDLEGVARGRLESGTLYGSLEDAAVDSLGSAKGTEAKAIAATYSAALLVSTKPDLSYLLRRARERGVQATVRELLAEIRVLYYSPRIPVEDVKALYAVRRVGPALPRGAGKGKPRWTLFSPDGLLDVVGKQLGVK